MLLRSVQVLWVCCISVSYTHLDVYKRQEFEKAVRSDRAHEAVVTGAKLIAFQAAKIFSDKDRIRAIKADFEKK